MKTYTGRERFSAAIKKTFTNERIIIDRIPVYPITGHCNAQLIKVSIRDFLLNPKTFVKAQVASYERRLLVFDQRACLT